MNLETAIHYLQTTKELVDSESVEAFDFIIDMLLNPTEADPLDIMFDDLLPGKQRQILEAYEVETPKEANWDEFPLATLPDPDEYDCNFFALVTEEGTAIAECTLCSTCFKSTLNTLTIEQSAPIEATKKWYDCSENDAIEGCVMCEAKNRNYYEQNQ